MAFQARCFNFINAVASRQAGTSASDRAWSHPREFRLVVVDHWAGEGLNPCFVGAEQPPVGMYHGPVVQANQRHGDSRIAHEHYCHAMTMRRAMPRSASVIRER